MTEESNSRQSRAKERRKERQKRARRRKNMIVAGVVLVVLAAAAGIGLLVNHSSGPAAAASTPPDAVTAGAAVEKGGLLVGDPAAPATLDLYEDFNCPVCGAFEKADGTTLSALIRDKKVKVRFHMLSFIDDHNGGTYSHRAANAFAAADAAAGPDKALELHAALYANQPEETSKVGLTDAQIIDIASGVGISSQRFVNDVHKGTFAGWVTQVADLGSQANVTGTPTIYLNGKSVQLQSLANPQSGQLDPALLTRLVEGK